MTRLLLTLMAVVAVLVLPVRILAQTRELSGTVTAASGARIANARVVLKNAANGSISSAITKKDGTYRVSSLTPGQYEVSVSAAGLAGTQTMVTMDASTDQIANFVLQATNQAAGTSGVSGVVNSQSVRELPLNGRSASDLATLEPGVASARTQQTGQAQRGFGNQMTISGGRPRQNDSRLDGISVNDYVNGPPGSALGVNLGADAVEQFSVLSSNYPAQYGRSSGGIISASTRSGTSQFHGDVYEFFRNSALDTRNYFDVKKPPFRRNQFGGSLGGPIQKDRTFIFGDYEGLRQSLGVTQVDTVPSPAARAGNLSSGQIAVDPNVLAFVNAFYPLPNGSLLASGDTGIYTF